ncbi:hypothetical protein F511_40539 [Dorcoceras hygrometricum]|uniref:Uncharacterized protein n=1 Tax=Dorcoceras hygrometricum TaxID=472368 RepID=A0A2Z7CQ73_9LAMI|nr:hypothetical protein F511_40539 [Dorcoceras hygrometricum]
MGSNPSTESNCKTAVNSKNKMQMLCMQPGTTAEGYNQAREPKNSMHSSTEICNRICGHGSMLNYKLKIRTSILCNNYHNKEPERSGLERARRRNTRPKTTTSRPRSSQHSLQEWYRMEELLKRSPTLSQTPKTTVGNDGNHRIKSTVNSTRVRETEVDNLENFTKYGIWYLKSKTKSFLNKSRDC